MKLVLAEKPSVAQSIAKVLGANKREDGYLEGGGYVVSWCVGHLVELAEPESYDEKFGKWSYNDLPIFPTDWKYNVSSSTKKQFGILKQLMARSDIDSLVCATDAGREGELIFRLVYHKAGCRKPFERLWISSMEDVAIKEGFENLRSGTEYDALYEAALCRERADWIVGINATRLFSTLYGQTLNVGRVMTPIRDSEVLMAKEKNSIGTCPICGSAVEDKAKAFFCSNRNCKFALWKNNRYFESIGKNMNASTAQKLLTAGKVKLKGCKSKKTGKSFDVIVYMEVSDDGKTNFSMEFENGGKHK